MKGAFAAAAMAAMATGADAFHSHGHARNMFARRGHEAASVCVPGCTTIYKYITGEPTLVPKAPATTHVPVVPSSSSVVKTVVPATTAQPTSTKVVHLPVPTPEVKNCPTPGTYTFPATTMTLTETTTVCGAQTTKVPSGIHTYGGVTTIVEQATTVTCPYAKETTSDGVVTSVIESTVYVCPSAGTYTIGASTKSVSTETILVYPVPTSYAPGTYTQPEQVVTVTETGYVYVCPYTSKGLPTAAPTTVAPKKPAAPATTSAPKHETPAPKPSHKTTVETPSKPAKKPNNGGQLKGNGDHWGITYTPYEGKTGKCKSQSAVDADIKSIKDSGFSIVRVYSTDCNALENVGGACKKHGVEMIMGIFVKKSGCTPETPEIKEQLDGISKWAQWDLVRLIVVGNEAIMNHLCTAEELATLVTTAKSKFSGYKGPFTIAETLNIYQQPETVKHLCDVIDVTGANIHPYFNSATTPSMAGTFVKGQLDLLKKVCPGNDVINLECGWPTRGNCNGVACPGKTEQLEAITSIRETAGDKTIFFSHEDDMWKEPGTCGCEQSWGSADCFQ